MTRATRTLATKMAEQSIKGAILSVFIEGIRQRNSNAIVNAVIMFTASYLPDITEHLYDVEFRPWQRVYAEGTMLAHALGFLGPYDNIWWWDHLTHILAATLLGGGIHAAARRRGHNPERAVLASVVGGGILWEGAEYVVHRVSGRLGVEPMLVHYGLRDTLLDFLFNLVGALLVLVFGDRLLRNVTKEVD